MGMENVGGRDDDDDTRDRRDTGEIRNKGEIESMEERKR